MVNKPKHETEPNYYHTPAEQQTLRSLSKLYELIIQFRKDAARSDDPELRLQFDMAAEIIAGLARSFRVVSGYHHEISDEHKPDIDIDSDCSC